MEQFSTLISRKKPILFLITLCILFNTNTLTGQNSVSKKNEQTVFVWGGDINLQFVRYIADLTNKVHPRICYIPTASGDNIDNIKYWESICNEISIEPYVLKVWVSSKVDKISFEDKLLNMDAIVVGGGNTLNMMGIWKAQGIDEIMRKALDKGIILAGGSAGSICWFRDGVSDSRPVHLSIVDGLSFLPYSNCPHYCDTLKQQMFHQMILAKQINGGYGCDELSGILFKNGKILESVSKNELNHSYYVSIKKGRLEIEKLESKLLVDKNALSEMEYRKIEVNKTMKEYALNANDEISTAFFSFIKKTTKDDKLVETSNRIEVLDVLIYKDSLVAIINKRPEFDFYCISLFYKNNETWSSEGEDIADTRKEAEIAFRERAKMHFNRLMKKY